MITFITFFTASLRAGRDDLPVPFSLFGRDPKETQSIYDRRGLQFGSEPITHYDEDRRQKKPKTPKLGPRDKGKEKIDEDEEGDREENNAGETDSPPQSAVGNSNNEDLEAPALYTLPSEIIVHILSYVFAGPHGEEHLKAVKSISKLMAQWSKTGLGNTRKRLIRSLLKSVEEYKPCSVDAEQIANYSSQKETVITFLNGVAAGRSSGILMDDIKKTEQWILRDDYQQGLELQKAYQLRLAIARILLFETGRFRALIYNARDCGIDDSILAYYEKNNPSLFKIILSEIKNWGISIFNL